MDRYTVILTGAGPHHSQASNDVDALVARLLLELRSSGHVDARATLTINGRDESVEAPATIAIKPAALVEPAVALSSKRPAPITE